MLIEKDIPENDKIILNTLGKNADTPIDNLLLLTRYKRKSSVYKRIRVLKSQNYFYGPFFNVNYNAIGTNKLFLMFVFAAYNRVHKEVVLTAMKKINCWIMIYPVRTADMYVGMYRCNNWNYIGNLFKLMKTWGWLKKYSVHKSEHRWIVQNPDFFGEFIPPHHHIPEGELPHYHYDDVDIDFEFSETDLIVLKHLSAKTCHLTEIRDFEYYYFGLKLKYQTIKKSYERLRQSGILIKKAFIVFPLPAAMCSFFFLLSKGKSLTSHLRMITHFGDGLRLTRGYTVTGNEVVSYFTAHPLLEGRILGMIEDNVDYATIYGVKTFPSGEFLTQTFNDNYFDVDSQRWIFPYSAFREELKKIKEE